MPLHALSAAPVASPKRGALWCVYVYWIYKEKFLCPFTKQTLCLPRCFAGSSFRVVWLLPQWEAELINVCPMNPFLLLLFEKAQLPLSSFHWTSCALRLGLSKLGHFNIVYFKALMLHLARRTSTSALSHLPEPPDAVCLGFMHSNTLDTWQ